MKFKELKSIELSSFTMMSTAITLILATLSTLALVLATAVMLPDGITLGIYLIPTLIVGAFMYGIYNFFCQGLLYNLLTKKLKAVTIALNGDAIAKVSTTETAMIIAIISTIQVILLYLVSVFVLPIFLTSVMQTLMFSGQQGLAYNIYQLLIVLSQPTTVALIIFGTFIITLVFTLIGTYIYNFLASKGRGISVELGDENGLTAIKSVDVLKLAIAISLISGILQVIMSVISIVSGGNALNAVINIIISFAGGFVTFFVIGFTYNILSEKIGKIKLELIDLKIN